MLYRAIGVLPDFPRELLAAMDNTVEDLQLATPWDGICRAARSHDVELVVIGAHGYGTLDRLLGTTSAKVVNHIDRDTLVVRERG